MKLAVAAAVAVGALVLPAANAAPAGTRPRDRHDGPRHAARVVRPGDADAPAGSRRSARDRRRLHGAARRTARKLAIGGVRRRRTCASSTSSACACSGRRSSACVTGPGSSRGCGRTGARGRWNLRRRRRPGASSRRPAHALAGNRLRRRPYFPTVSRCSFGRTSTRLRPRRSRSSTRRPRSDGDARSRRDRLPDAAATNSRYAPRASRWTRRHGAPSWLVRTTRSRPWISAPSRSPTTVVRTAFSRSPCRDRDVSRVGSAAACCGLGRGRIPRRGPADRRHA